MGDCLFSIFALCCALGLDAETVLHAAISKYQKRFEQKGAITQANEKVLKGIDV